MNLRTATPAELLLRRGKVLGLSVRRWMRWARDPAFAAPRRVAPHGAVVRELRVPIARHGAHPTLEAGKRHNVRLAATAFHGVVIGPSAPLSFWRTLGPATARRGFVAGMEVRSGCVVPAIGGGLCLLSNALFTLAVELGWDLLERHGHTMALADAGALDATVAYPYVDLRIAPRVGLVHLDVTVRGDVLVVQVRSAAPVAVPRVALTATCTDTGGLRRHTVRRRVFDGDDLVDDALIADDRQTIPASLRSCLDCGETACHARQDA